MTNKMIRNAVRAFFLIYALLLNCILFAQENRTILPQRKIEVNANVEKGDFNQFFKFCVGAGRAHEGLIGDWQRQLAEAKKECDFQRIRFHGLLHDEMGVYREDKNGIHLNFQYIDALFDYLTDIGVVPFVELGFMPEQLRSGEGTIFWWKGNVTPPNNYDKWQYLIEQLVEHLKDRYGEDEIANWYFEVWNEPNLHGFFHGTQDDYFKLYETTAKAIKKVSQRFKVGGPATAGCQWIDDMVKFCEFRQLPIDFITTHCYGVEGYLDECGVSQLRMPANVDAVVQQVESAFGQLEKNPLYSHLEVHFTEWSSSYSPRDPYHDVYQNAPYLLHTLKHVNNRPTSMSYWTFTDIFEEPGTVPSPFHGGFGLMNFQGIKKPSYFAYKFLCEMGNKELKNSDEESWVCKDDHGDIQFLFWNLTHLDQGQEPNTVFYKRRLPAKNVETADIQCAGLPPGKYMREVYRTGYQQNDCYTTYLDLGSPVNLSVEQIKYLKQMASGKACNQALVEIGADGIYKERFTVRENDVYFVKLKLIQ